MIKQILFISTIILLCSSVTGFCENSSALPKKSDESLIGAFSLAELPYEITGCSCWFYTDSEDLVFASNASNKVWMKIDGKLVPLKLKESQAMRDVGSIGTKKIGAKLNFIYTVDDALVSIELEATSACPLGAESCEGQKYNATFIVTKGTRQQTIKAKGSCGC